MKGISQNKRTSEKFIDFDFPNYSHQYPRKWKHSKLKKWGHLFPICLVMFRKGLARKKEEVFKAKKRERHSTLSGRILWNYQLLCLGISQPNLTVMSSFFHQLRNKYHCPPPRLSVPQTCVFHLYKSSRLSQDRRNIMSVSPEEKKRWICFNVVFGVNKAVFA